MAKDCLEGGRLTFRAWSQRVSGARVPVWYIGSAEDTVYERFCTRRYTPDEGEQGVWVRGSGEGVQKVSVRGVESRVCDGAWEGGEDGFIGIQSVYGRKGVEERAISCQHVTNEQELAAGEYQDGDDDLVRRGAAEGR